MTWLTNEQPFGVNHAPLLSGLASDGSGAEVPVAVDPDTGELLVSGGGGGGDVTVVSPIGQTTMADSVSVAIASDQSTIPVADATAEGYLSDIQQTTEPSGHSGGFSRVIGIGGVTSGGVTDVVHIDDDNNLLTVAAQTGTWNVGTTSAVVNVGQQTVNTTAVQLSASSTVPTNGIIVKALSTNSASIFVGGSGVTTTTGYELTPGESVSFTCNLNTLYIRSAASTTDKACWDVQ